MRRRLLMAIWIPALSGWFAALGAAGEPPSGKTLETVGMALDTRVQPWTVREGDSAPAEYRLGARLTTPRVTLKAVVPAREVLAGTRLAGSPVRLRIRLEARGMVTVNLRVNGSVRETFTADGGGGTVAEARKEFPLVERADASPLEVFLEVVNDGFKPPRDAFWPERRRALEEKGAWVVLREAEAVYPAAEVPLQAARDWLTSFRTAAQLLYPKMVRFTFTGKPYDIPDRRGLDPARLAALQAEFEAAAGAFDVSLLIGGNAEGLLQSIERSYSQAKNVAAYARDFHVSLIGNAHIDIAWLWRLAETVQVARNTYDTVLKNMDEYPELLYAQSQALTYRWLETRYPEIFRRIQEKVKAGRWEIVGGMWVEPDCNLIGGESWVRQILFGKTYFKEKFGVDVRIGWNPDSFGYNWNMPQIYKKSGIDAFITQKLWWNDTTVFPHFLFWWQGADDTRLLTYLPPLAYDSRVQLQEEVLPGLTRYQATTGRTDALILFGLGDHGGGPNREILDRVRGYAKLKIAPTFTEGKAADFLAPILQAGGLDLPVWKDELYLEYHQGTYTTQAAIKKCNREGESRVLAAEKLASVASLLGAAYPAETLHEIWTLLLTHQFHDILPGSSITAVYRDALEQYARVQKLTGRVIDRALADLAGRIDVRGVAGAPLVVFNPLSWERTDLVTVRTPYPVGTKLSVRDAAGREVPCETDFDRDDDTLTLRFVAEKVPPVGYKAYGVVKAAPPAGKAEQVKAAENALENEFYRIRINPVTGNLTSVFDKRQNREFVAPGREANVLWVYEDAPENWDAWNIGYTGRGWELNRADKVELLRATPVRATYRVSKSFLGFTKERESPTEDFPSSFFTQDITLYRGLDRIDVATQADWWEDHLSLKAVFPVAVQAEQATFEIPFAAVRRTTRFETLWEKARYETPALRWADLSDAAGGVSLLNDSKYGYDVHGNVMKLSLLRSPTWPDPLADRGKHAFTYSLYPHAGGFGDGQTVRRGLELNNPLLAAFTPSTGSGAPPGAASPSLPAEASFFQVESASVVLDTVKQAEKGDGLILRLYEAHGAPGKASLTFFRRPKAVAETDLLENAQRPVPLKGNQLDLDLTKFEIRTLKVTFD